MGPALPYSSSGTEISWSTIQACAPYIAPTHSLVYLEPEEMLRGEFRRIWRSDVSTEVPNQSPAPPPRATASPISSHPRQPAASPRTIPSPISSSQTKVFAGSLDADKLAQTASEGSNTRADVPYAAGRTSQETPGGINPTARGSSSRNRTANSSDPANPRNWHTRKKCMVSSFVLISSFLATFGTAVYASAASSVQKEFHVSQMLSLLPLSAYAWGMALSALFSAATSEVFGRAMMYKVSLPLELVFIVVGGVAQNYTMIIVSRTLAGIFAGPSITVGVGILNDMWDMSLDKIGTAFGALLDLFLVLGIEIGPLVSAAIIAGKHINLPAIALSPTWRWTFWDHSILIGVVMLWAFTLPETYHPAIIRKLEKKAGVHVSERNFTGAIKASAGRPLYMMLVELIIFPSGLVMSITQSVVFFYYLAYGVLFESIYNFTPYQAGIAFAPMAVGSIIALPIVGLFDKLIYQSARAPAQRTGGVVAPEKRLYPAMLGTVLMPVSIFWLAFTGQQGIHWSAPLCSGLVFGIAFALQQVSIQMYTKDIYGVRLGASVNGVTTSMRFTISAAVPLLIQPMITLLGLEWVLVLLAGIAAAMIPIPWTFINWGPKLRTRSRSLGTGTEI